MTVLRYLTLPGVGQDTKLEHLRELSSWHPFVEWLVEYDPSRAGQEPCYPTLEWLAEFVDFAADHKLHICLRLHRLAVENVLSLFEGEQPLLSQGEATPSNPRDEVLNLFKRFGRIQLATTLSMAQLEAFKALRLHCRNGLKHQPALVLPLNASNLKVCDSLGYRTYDIDMLAMDPVSRTDGGTWPHEDPRKIHKLGCAIELTPESLEGTWARLTAPLDADDWLWLEAKGNGALIDLDSAEALLEAAGELLQRQADQALTNPEPYNYKVSLLSEFWLEWWASKALGLDVAPLIAASGSVLTHDREHGHYACVDLWRQESEYLKVFAREQLAFMPDGYGAWHSWHCDGARWDVPRVPGPTLRIAGLRALVQKRFGEYVPLQFDLRRE